MTLNPSNRIDTVDATKAWLARRKNQKETAMSYGTNGLTFNTLRQGNIHRLPQFKNAKGEAAHSSSDGSDWSTAEWLQAVVGELGELANILKKVRRGDMTMAKVKGDVADELADVATYLDILAFRLGIDLGEAIMDKFNRVSKRVGSTVTIDAEDWHYSEAVADA